MAKFRIFKGYRTYTPEDFGAGRTAPHAKPATGKPKEKPKGKRTPPTKPAPRIWKNQDVGAKEWMERFKWVRVISSNVLAIRYDKVRKEMHVMFKRGNGAFYVYFHVSSQIAVGMYYAASKGKFVWKRLRDKYSYTKRAG